MEIIHILLAGKDMEYCRALTKSITQLSRELIVTIVNHADQDWLENKSHDLILYEGWVQNELLPKRSGAILLVEDRKNAGNEVEAGISTLYKYGNVKELIKEILLTYNLVTGKIVNTFSDNNCKILSVYSGIGGSGKTCVSLGLAQEFVRFREKKTLYVNFEEWDHTGNYFETAHLNKLNSIGDYLYYCSRGKQVNLDSFLDTDVYGICHFKPVVGRNQLKNLNSDEFSYFVNNLMEAEWLEYIIFDCSNCLDENTLWLLKNSNTIVYLTDNRFTADSSFHSRATDYNEDPVLQCLKEKSTSEILERIISVTNGKEAYETEDANEKTILIESDSGSFQSENGKCRINIERGFGQGIRKLADGIENSSHV